MSLLLSLVIEYVIKCLDYHFAPKIKVSSIHTTGDVLDIEKKKIGLRNVLWNVRNFREETKLLLIVRLSKNT